MANYVLHCGHLRCKVTHGRINALLLDTIDALASLFTSRDNGKP